MLFLGAMLIGCGDTAKKGDGKASGDAKKGTPTASTKMVSLNVEGMV